MVFYMSRMKSFIFSIFIVSIAFAGIQISSPAQANAELIGSTSMTVVTVREWRTAQLETPIFWPQNFGVYDYQIHIPGQSWSNNPHPIPFKPDANGARGGILWNVYDEYCKTGNKTFVAFAWDFIGATTTGKHEGTGVRDCGWEGMMYTSIYKQGNTVQPKERSNLVFDAK